MTTSMVLADGDYSAGTWIGTAFAVALVFVLAVALVGLIWWLVQVRRDSYKKAVLDPVVPLSAVVITVGFQLIVHH